MKRVLAVALLLVAIPAAGAEETGTYEGKDTAAWLKVLTGKDEAPRAHAAAALSHIGPPAAEAIPALAKALVSSPKNEDLRVNAALALGKIGTTEDRFGGSGFPRGMPDLPGMGPHNHPDPKPAPAPGDEPGEPGAEPGAGGEEAPAPAPVPEPAKVDPAAAKRSEDNRKISVPALVRALADPVSDVRVNATRALAYLGKDAAEAAKPLVKALSDKTGSTRANAAVALATMPDAAGDAVPVLAKLLSDPYPSAANAAANALKAVGPKALPALKSVQEALLKDVENPRYQGPPGYTPREGAAGGGSVFGGSPPLSVNLCLLLGGLGKDAAPALPAVFRALKAKSSSTRNAAIQTVSAIRSDPEKSVAALVGCLTDEFKENRGLAAIALGDFGPDARSALPDLQKLRDSAEGSVRQNAQYAIDRIGGKAVATGDGEVAPAMPGGYSLHGGSGGDTTEVWR